MDLSPRQRDLSQELGLVIRPPSEFYPRTLEEPNLLFEKFDDLMETMIRGVGNQSAPVASRERYISGTLEGVGSGPGTTGALIEFAIDHWYAGSIIVMSYMQTFHPDESKEIGKKIKAAISVKAMVDTLDRVGTSLNLALSSQRIASATQGVVEGLCYRDALERRQTGERWFRLESFARFSVPGATPLRPDGREYYELRITSSHATYHYTMNGRGDGWVIVFRASDGRYEKVDLSLLWHENAQDES
jgi:hypothetical protein